MQTFSIFKNSVISEIPNFRNKIQNHKTYSMPTKNKATYSVTFDLLILEIMFLFIKYTVKSLKFRYIFYHFCKSLQIFTIKTTAFMIKINCLEFLEGRK